MLNLGLFGAHSGTSRFALQTSEMQPIHATQHAENFPVASWLAPPEMRPAIVAIYRFARMADDLADEGEVDPQTRLAGLAECRRQLAAIAAGAADANDPIYGPLASTISRHRLSISLFEALLSAFEQDVVQTRWPDLEALTDYCSRSANPIGRLMLELVDIRDPSRLQASDAICTALQRINFLQDLQIDWHRGRLYIPQAELDRFGVREADIASSITGGLGATASLRALLRLEHDRCLTLLRAGLPLAQSIPGRLGLEITATIAGGAQLLRRFRRLDYDSTLHRPVLRPIDWLMIGIRSLLRRPVP